MNFILNDKALRYWWRLADPSGGSAYYAVRRKKRFLRFRPPEGRNGHKAYRADEHFRRRSARQRKSKPPQNKRFKIHPTALHITTTPKAANQHLGGFQRGRKRLPLAGFKRTESFCSGIGKGVLQRPSRGCGASSPTKERSFIS